VSPSENGGGFARRYFEAMQRDPAAVLGHRDMIQVFGKLGVRVRNGPEPGDSPERA